MTEPNVPTTCRHCAGNGWKYATHRTAVRVIAQSCGDARSVCRRSCVDCGGTGRAPVGS
ncbi:hypothetical protein [Micromonospora sp. CPCC 206061]|uniref:hypothetical protein n=1 Tax=Micromonospora sp. CPCC 206061 TaxID=3122410 RepID=UPI002FF1BE71